MNTIAAKLAKASINVGALVEDKRNSEQNYKYISADQVLSKCGHALAKEGLVIIPEVTNITINSVERQGKSPRLDAAVIFNMHITDGESESYYGWQGYGSDYSVPDKAVYKAITSGHKYFLMKLLNVGTGNDDSEHEDPETPPQEIPEAVKVAMDFVNSKGQRYGDLDTSTLFYMRKSLIKALETEQDENEKDIKSAKLEAANQILSWRESQSANK